MSKFLTAPPVPGLRSIRELEVRYRPTGLKVPNAVLHTPAEAANVFKAVTDRSPTESFVAAHLDNRHRVVAVHEAARGSGNVVHVSPRDIFSPALVTGATSVIVAHNHPSGDALPSSDDKIITARLKAAGELIGVPVLDHIVIGENDAYSFQSESHMRNLWASDRSYSTGGWGSFLLPVAGIVAVLAIIIVMRRREARTIVVGGAVETGYDLLAAL